MNQDKIWDYWQNEGQSEAPHRFRSGAARHAFLAGKVRPKGKVLNVGVGVGVFEELALKQGLDVYSLDPSERSIVALRERLGLGEKAKAGYGQDMPFDDDSFDAVVISETIEHLSEDVTRQTLDEISRVLVPGGRIIGTVPARENLGDQLVMCPDCGKRFHRWGHLQSFDPESMKTLLSRCFEVEEVLERPFISLSNRDWKGKLRAIVRMALYRLGVHWGYENLVFVARKPYA